ncbi:hypothetical protein [Paenisporosarcina indica]|uniref:hypothetical protein n=1 Tax=Paenisporosarcina indica TaxID=650093 RepID=UPI00094FD6A1|nr:hypothetical protein [Paenisporosarcina indica]
MNADAIKQVLRTLRQFKTSAILHEYQNFTLHYCGQSDSFIITNSITQEVKEFKDLDKCATVIKKMIQDPYGLFNNMKVNTD